MKKNFLMISLVMSGLAFSQDVDTLTTDSVKVIEQVKTTGVITTTSTQCTGITKANARCKLKTRHESGMCHHHRPKVVVDEPQADCMNCDEVD